MKKQKGNAAFLVSFRAVEQIDARHELIRNPHRSKRTPRNPESSLPNQNERHGTERSGNASAYGATGTSDPKYAPNTSSAHVTRKHSQNPEERKTKQKRSNKREQDVRVRRHCGRRELATNETPSPKSATANSSRARPESSRTHAPISRKTTIPPNTPISRTAQTQI